MAPRISLAGVRRRHVAVATAATAAAVALALAGCSGGPASSGSSDSASSGATKVGDVLNIAAPSLSGRTSLDPAASWVSQTEIAYDTLITYEPDGSYGPGLATKFGYKVPGKVFDLTLRKGVKFSDGTTMTAEGVKESYDYMAAHDVNPSYFAGKTMTVTGPLSVEVTSTAADPTIPALLSAQNQTGFVISPQALKNPAALATSTDGAGEYQLDAADTVTGDHYTYVQNPHYWNPKAVHYKKLVLKVIADPTSLLNAMKAGQEDVAFADNSTAPAAKSAGLKVSVSPGIFVGLILADRDGVISKPLSDVRVRQAINYAVDRKTLTKALFGDYGTPTDQTVIKGQDGYVDKTLYDYDPKKAKSLLAAAGYANGFTLDAVATNTHSRNIYTQAMAGELEKVGIKLNVINENPDTSYYHDLEGAKYPSGAMYLGAGSMFFEGQFLFLPTAQFNPFHTSDAKLLSLYQQAAAAPDAQRKKLDQQMEEHLMDLAWVAPISFIDTVMYSRPDIAGVDLTPGNGVSNPVWWKPAA